MLVFEERGNLRREENWNSWRKTSRSRVENQHTQPPYDTGSANRTRDTLVEGERSHHCTNHAPQTFHRKNASMKLQIWNFQTGVRSKTKNLRWERYGYFLEQNKFTVCFTTYRGCMTVTPNNGSNKLLKNSA